MWKARVLAVAALVVFAGCSGGGDDGGGTGPEPVFTSLTISPSNPSVTVGGTTTLTATAKDQSNNTMSGLQVTYTSGNTAIATVTNAGVVTGVALGPAQITATGVIGSVTKTQQVTVTVSAPGASASVAATADQRFDPASVTIVPGGTVTWSFAILHNVTFDGTPPPGGNIGNTASGNASRTFPTAGTYAYHCTIHAGMSGQVLVQP
jgi:plastocyanin